MLELKRELVRVIGGNAGYSEKNNTEYALLKYKTSRGYEGMEYIADADAEVQALVRDLDTQMGKEITLVTSIEA